jgi:hypothetical protein
MKKSRIFNSTLPEFSKSIKSDKSEKKANYYNH